MREWIIGRAAATSALMFALAACDSGPGFAETQYGIAAITQTSRVGGEFDVDVQVRFFRAERAPLPTSTDQTSACAIGPASPPPAVSPGFVRIAAGDSIVATARGASAWLYPTEQPQVMLYARVDDPPLVAAPGDEVQIVVPGAARGFPPATVTVVVLATPVFDEVEIPPDGESLAVTWAPPGGAATRMRLALRYTPAGGGEAEEIVCQVPDNGSFTIPDEFLAGWRAAPAPSRTGIGARWRSEQTVRGESVLAAYVQVESSIPVAP